jgi:hypothetical protein
MVEASDTPSTDSTDDIATSPPTLSPSEGEDNNSVTSSSSSSSYRHQTNCEEPSSPQNGTFSSMENLPSAKDQRVYNRKKKPIQENDSEINVSYNDDDQRFYVTKSGRTTKPNPIYSYAASTITGDPDTLQQARMCHDAEQWNAEIDREFKSLWDGGTFEKIDNVPEGHKPVKSKFTFKRVLNPDGTLKKHRVRVVVRGDQQPWQTFNETFAGTAHRKSVMLLLSLAAQEKMEICTADVKSAFLIPTLEEEIYMELPLSFTGKNNR